MVDDGELAESAGETVIDGSVIDDSREKCPAEQS
jgi:hypothetical protein